MQKKKSFVFIVVGLFLIILVVLFAAIAYFGTKEKVASVCEHSYGYTVYNVSIRDDKIDPSHIDAHLCDKIKVTNYDDKFRVIAFGEHEDHTAYDGVLERTLKTNGKFEFTLDKTGDFVFHDHLDEQAEASFSVTERSN